MKTTRHLLLVFVLLWTAVACDKDNDDDDDDPRPNLAAEVAGNYTVTQIVQDSRVVTFPAEDQNGNVLSGTLTLNEVNEETVNGVLEFSRNGQPDPNSRADIGNISLELARDSSSITLLDGSQRIGTYTQDEVRLSGTSDGAEIEIVASK